MKYFVSAILPGIMQLGAMQFEAESDGEAIATSERLCPSRVQFRSYRVEEFDPDMAINEFVTAEKLKSLGY